MSISNLGAIKKYFGTDRPVTLQELKALTPEERAELGAGAARELGETITAPKAKT